MLLNTFTVSQQQLYQKKKKEKKEGEKRRKLRFENRVCMDIRGIC